MLNQNNKNQNDNYQKLLFYNQDFYFELYKMLINILYPYNYHLLVV